MADKLQKELLDIQEKLGGTRDVPPEGTTDKLQWHLDKLEELAGGGGSGGVSDIKVDGTSIVDSEGNAYLVTKSAYDPVSNRFATEADVGGGSANFNVVEQIQSTYDEGADRTYWIFPENILPLQYYSDCYGATIYFDFKNWTIVDSDGTEIEGGYLEIINGKQVKISMDFDYYSADRTADELLYSILDCGSETSIFSNLNGLNTYKLFFGTAPKAKQISGNADTGNLYFLRIKPWNNVTTAWRVVYEIEITKNSYNNDAKSFGAKVTVSDRGGTSSMDNCWIIAENRIGATSGSAYNAPIWNHCVQLVTKNGLNNGRGHVIGANFNVSTYYNFKIYIKVLEADRCDVEVFDSLTTLTDLPENSYKSNNITAQSDIDLASNSISNASKNVMVTTPQSGNTKYYLVGTSRSQTSRGSGDTEELYGAYGNQTYIDADGNLNISKIISNGAYLISLPNKAGTFATLDDCGGSIPIDDLRNIPPTPSIEYFISDVSYEGNDTIITFSFDKGCVLDYLEIHDNSVEEDFIADGEYDASEPDYSVTTDNCDNCGYVMCSAEQAQAYSYICLKVYGYHLSLSNLSISDAQFIEIEGEFDYEC